ncbi:MAG: N-acetyl-gamma-glutamyl-phosphate reductase [Candidatus Walczuchella monophlebidarum]
MIQIGILGSSGYTAGELLRLLLHHPKVQIKSVVSSTQSGIEVSKIHQDLLGDTELCFTDHLESVEVVFLCLGHGHSRNAVKKISTNSCIIDLSHDFRLSQHANFSCRNFVYGLPELQRQAIKKAKNIANPGCFATAIELPLLPLAKERWLDNDIHISAITGSSGSGRLLRESNHFSWRVNNVSTYKVFTHQHLKEIREVLLRLCPSFNKKLFFVPYRGNFSRGIFATLYTYCKAPLQEVEFLYQEFYKNHPFTHLSKDPLCLKQVVNTNKCLLHLMKEKEQLIISSVIDNLVKGAAGQAVQNMNLMYNLEEVLGLQIKSIAF